MIDKTHKNGELGYHKVKATLKCKWNWGNPHLNRKKIRAGVRRIILQNHFIYSIFKTLSLLKNPPKIERKKSDFFFKRKYLKNGKR